MAVYNVLVERESVVQDCISCPPGPIQTRKLERKIKRRTDSGSSGIMAEVRLDAGICTISKLSDGTFLRSIQCICTPCL